MACTNICAKLTQDSLQDCNFKSTGGIFQEVKLINRCDFLKSDFTIDTAFDDLTCSHVISATTIADPSTLNAVTYTANPSKRNMGATFSAEENDFDVLFSHSVRLFTQGMTEQAMCNIKTLASGAEVVAIIRNKTSLVTEEFWVYGIDNGLKLVGDFTYDTNENNGNTLLSLASKEPDFEPFPPIKLLITDQPTTLAFFDAL